MSIVPSGTKRTMVAQTFSQDASGLDIDDKTLSDMGLGQDQSFNKNTLESGSPDQMPGDPFSSEQNLSAPTEGKADESQSDVSVYIFEKLEGFGYPPRRLQEFENDFVDEKIYPGGVTEMTIVIPDQYYGKKGRISNKDFSSIIQDIQDKFGLTFVDAERKDKKITMNFSSQKPQKEDGEGEEAEFESDILDDVYGGGSDKKGRKKTKVKASTMNELLKVSRQQVLDILLKDTEK